MASRPPPKGGVHSRKSDAGTQTAADGSSAAEKFLFFLAMSEIMRWKYLYGFFSYNIVKMRVGALVYT